MPKFKKQKISKGHYLYRGFKVNCVGYYPPEQRVCWEAVDENGCGFAHSYSLNHTLNLIDEDIEWEKRKTQGNDINGDKDINGYTVVK